MERDHSINNPSWFASCQRAYDNRSEPDPPKVEHCDKCKKLVPIDELNSETGWCEECEDAYREASMAEALAEYPAHKAKQKLEEEQEECDHSELDHGICLSCGRDCFDDLVDRAEWARDAARDDWADRQGQ